MPADRRKRFLVFGGLGLVALVLLLWAVFHKPADKTAAPPPIPVTAETAVTQDLTLSIGALGAAQAWTSDTILAQVSGKLLRVDFTEGGDVHAGQVLAEVDPAPYRAVLMQATGTLHHDEAVLAGALRDLTRYQNLLQTSAVPRQTEEDEEATVAQDRAQVETDKGTVAAAAVNVRWCTIRSPISGRAGVRLVDAGNLVSASGSTSSAQSTASATSSASATTTGGSGIVVINQIEPIAVTFTVPEGQFERLSQISDGFSKPLPLQATSQETDKVLDTGTLTIADNKVDPATGSVELKAKFPNRGHHLWPGQFVNVSLGAEQLVRATVIPVTAVNRGPKGTFVFVIGADHKVTIRPVEVAGIEGANAAIKRGVNPGETVVTDGQMTLKAGSQVRVTRPAPGA